MDVEDDDGWGMPSPRPDPEAAREGGRQAPAVRWSAGLGQAIVRRLAKGESLRAICARPGAPHRSTVRAWAREKPDFGREMADAARAARLRRRRADLMRALRPRDPRGAWCTYSHAVGAEICRRLAGGETLIEICRDLQAREGSPCYATVLNWARAVPEFGEAYADARRLAGDYLFDEAREVAKAATPGTIWVDRLRFDVIRWQTARIAPRKYVERVLAAEAVEAIKAAARASAAEAKDGGLTVIIKRYSDVTPEEEALGDEGEP